MKPDIENMINLYFDCELEKGKEPILFSLLSRDEDARSYFKQMNTLKTNIPFTMEEVPFDLEKKILYSAAEKNSKHIFTFTRTNVFAFASYAATVVLLVLTIFLFIQSREYKNTIQTVSEQMENQKEEIQLLINSLPAAEVTSKYENATIIKANL